MKKLEMAIFESLPSGRKYVSLADVDFKDHCGDRFEGGLNGDIESELLRFCGTDEKLELGLKMAAWILL